ncbi:MAG: hypothetical protein P4L33_05785 [Capsulimonadaceae bacterium]|nr:hypothetical protein [Capsulimonadaceae bacterium]
MSSKEMPCTTAPQLLLDMARPALLRSQGGELVEPAGHFSCVEDGDFVASSWL